MCDSSQINPIPPNIRKAFIPVSLQNIMNGQKNSQNATNPKIYQFMARCGICGCWGENKGADQMHIGHVADSAFVLAS